MPLFLEEGGSVAEEFQIPEEITFDEAMTGEAAATAEIGFARAKTPEPQPWTEYIARKLPGFGLGVSLAESLDISGVAERVRANQASQQDFDKLTKFLARRQDESERNWLERTGNLALEIPGFALEFLATGGAATGVRAAATKSLGKLAQSGAGKLAVGAAGAAAQTIANPARIAEATLGRRLPGTEQEVLAGPDESMAESVLKGTLDHFIETASEQSGAQLAKAVGLTRLKTAVMTRLLGKGQAPKTAARNAAKLLERAGYHGIPEELLEEHAGEIARYGTGVEKDAGVVGDVVGGAAAIAQGDVAGGFKRLGEAASEEASRAVAFSAFPAAQTPTAVAIGRSRQQALESAKAGRDIRQKLMDQVLTPETVSRWAADNPDQAAEMATVPVPSRQQWEEDYGLPKRTSQSQRKQFADLVRQHLFSGGTAEPGETEDDGVTPPDAGPTVVPPVTPPGTPPAPPPVAPEPTATTPVVPPTGTPPQPPGPAGGVTPPSPAESEFAARVNVAVASVPAWKEAGVSVDDASKTARVELADGRSTTIHFDADEEMDRVSKKTGKNARGAYVYTTGKRGEFSEGHIYLSSKADHETLNHEAVHWMEDVGVITPEEVAEHGGREGFAKAYAAWVTGERTDEKGVFRRVVDFVARFLGYGDAKRKAVFEDIEKRTQKSPAPAPAPAPPAEDKPPAVRLARRIADHLGKTGGIDKATLFGWTNEEFGGTRAEGTFAAKRAYDALEVATNLLLKEQQISSDPQQAIQQIQELQSRLVSQTKRDEITDTAQQFSTPPAYAYAVVRIANVQPGETALEPSAGTGTIATQLEIAGAKVHANEIDQIRVASGELVDNPRLPMIRSLYPDATPFDAEQADSLLHGLVDPSVIVMNPPFSHAGHKFGNKTILGMDRSHVKSALRLLRPGGRLVAIMGAPMQEKKSKGEKKEGVAFGKWLNELRTEYSVRANVIMTSKVYKGYGTDFPTRVLVIDKPGTGQAPRGEAILQGRAESLNDLVTMLEGVRNDRQPIEQGGSQATGGTGVRTGEQSAGDVPADEGSGEPGGSGPGVSGTGPVDGGRTSTGSKSSSKGTKRESDSGAGSGGSGGRKSSGGRTDTSSGDQGESSTGGGGDSGGPAASKPASDTGAPSGLKPGSPEWIRWKAGQRKESADKPPADKTPTQPDAPPPPSQSAENRFYAEFWPAGWVTEESMGDGFRVANDKERKKSPWFPTKDQAFQWLFNKTDLGVASRPDRSPTPKSKGDKSPSPAPPPPAAPPQAPPAAPPAKKPGNRWKKIQDYASGDALRRIRNVQAMSAKYGADNVLDDPKMLELVSEVVGDAFENGPHDFRAFIAEAVENLDPDLVRNIGPGIEWAWNLVRDEADTAGRMSESSDVAKLVDELLAQEEDKKQLGDDTFQPYTPTMEYPGAKKHPGTLVESTAMSAVEAPPVTYQLDLPEKAIKYMSSEQLEQIARCCQAHEGHLDERTRAQVRDWGNPKYPRPARVAYRRGYLIGDGTGVGKTIELLGVIAENRRKGRKKAVVVTASEELVEQMRRDWANLGENPDLIFTKPDNWGKIEAKEGILVIAYTSLGTQSQGATPVRRLNQVVDWLGAESDNVICYDESHNMANVEKQTRKALAGIELADTVPDARVVYLSATAGVELEHLSYCDRLGLWGPGTEFVDSKDFVGSLGLGEIAAMECCSQSMKAMGLYLSRGIAFRINQDENDERNVQLDPVTHELSAEQLAIYNRIAEAWAKVIEGFNTSAQNTNQGRWDTSNFYAEQLRFFDLLVTAMKMPSVIKQIEEDLAADRSVFIQVQSTGEAALTRAIDALAEDADPSEARPNMIDDLIHLVETDFPTQQWEEVPDPNDPTKTIKRPMVYPPGHPKAGQPVQNPQAVRAKNALIEDLRTIPAPDPAINQLIDYFGPDAVAEVSGRGHRIVDHGGKREYQKLSKKRRMAEHQAFQEGRKRIAVVSRVGSTGFDFHAGLDVKNQQRRAHYMLQPGWSAIMALQGLGRTHRTNQASAPIVRPIASSIQGEKRFISTIARRIAQAGAIAKGQRQASGDLYKPSDNLESREARQALRDLIEDLVQGRVDGMTAQDFETLTNIKLLDRKGNINEETARNTGRFFNRMLALPIPMQETLFNLYAERLDDIIASATAAGTLDTGVTSIKADRVEKADDQEIYRQGAASVRHVEVTAFHRNKPIDFETAKMIERPIGFYKNLRSGRVYFLSGSDLTKTDPQTGRVFQQVRRQGVLKREHILRNDMEDETKYEKIRSPEDAKAAWEADVASTPEYSQEAVHLISGALIPIWKKIDGNPKIERVTFPDGEQVIGRRVNQRELDSLLTRLGKQRGQKVYTAAEIAEGLNSGAIVAVLANQWKLDTVMRDGERRIRLSGPSFASEAQVTRIGVFKERVPGRVEYFVPTGDGAEAVLTELFKISPVATVQQTEQEDDEQALGIGGASGSPARLNMPANKTVKRGVKNPIGARDVIELMESEFGIIIRFGRLPGKALRGVYKRVWMMARGKGDESASIDVAAHEIAHGIDQRTDLRSGLSRSSTEIAELRPLDYEPTKGRPSEGFAEFVRGYLTDDIDVATVAPAFTKHFETWLDKPENAKWRKAFDRVKERINFFRDEGALARVRGQRGNIGDRPRAAWSAKTRKFINDQYMKWMSSLVYGEKFQANLKSRGYNPKKGASFIDIIKAWNQGAATLAHTALENGVFTMSGGNVRTLSKSLWETMKGVDAKDYEDWADWAYARHAIESWSQNKNPGITLEDARAVYNEFKGRPGWEEAAQGLTDFNNALIDMAVDVGSLSADEGQAIKDSYKTYMPLFRLVPENISPEGVGGVGLVDPGKLVKGRRGSGYKIIDPVQATIKKAIQFYDAAAKQAAINEMVRAARKHGANGWMEFVPPRQRVTTASVREALEQAGVPSAEIDALEAAGLDVDAISRIYRPNYQPDPSKPEARILLDGKPQMVMFHVPELYEMVTGMGYFQVPGWADATFGRLTRFIRLTATSLNPAFIARNFIRDFDTYLLNRDYGNVTDPAYFVAGYAMSETKRRFGGEEDAWVEAWRKYGGQLSGPLAMDRQSIRNAVASAVAGRQKFGVLESIIDMAQVTEAGPRLAEFVGVWKKHGWTREMVRDGIDNGSLPRDILIEALNAAHEVTIDFRRSGTIGRYFSRIIPFFNANVQAVDKNVRTFKDHPARTLLRVFGQAVVPAIAYWLMHHDEDWYEEREDWMSMFWIVTDDEGNPIGRFPRGHLTGQIAAGVEALLDMLYEDDPERLKTWLPMFLRSQVPPTDVSGVGTLIELGLNKDFRGKPIVSKGLQHLQPGDQANQWNTALMKSIGQWAGVSPAKLEYAVNDLTGGMYRRLANRVSLVDSWWQGDPLSIADLPVVEGFALRGEHTKSVDEFYTRSDELSAQRASAKLRNESLPKADETTYRRITRTRDLMSELRNAAQQMTPQSDKRMAVERMIVGAARFALGKDPLDLYPNPLTTKELPAEVKKVVNDHLATAAYTTARIADLRSANDDDRASQKAAETYLEETEVEWSRLNLVLGRKLRRQGYGSEAVNAWRSRLRARLRVQTVNPE